MKAIIMAGGFGTRLRPLTLSIPKPMVPIVNRPVMEHVVELLKGHGFDELIVLLYFQAESIQNYFGSGEKWGVKIIYDRPDADYGTAGSVRRALKYLNDETFLVISADVLSDFNLESAVHEHQAKGAVATLVMTRVKNPLSYGIVITAEDGKILSFLEKPTWGEVFSDTINSGIYVLEPEALERVPADGDFDFSKDLFPLLLKEKAPLYGAIASGYWKDIGNIRDYLQANMDVLQGEVNISVPGERLSRMGKDVWVAGNVQLHPKAKLRGTVILGEGSEVQSDVLLSNCIIGPGCQLREGTEIEQSVLWDQVQIGSQSTLSKAVICSGVQIGSLVTVQEGVVIADQATIGRGATITTGVRIWPKKEVEAGSTVTSSLIWGERWSKVLFGHYGITGLANVEITPEFSAKVGSAYGSIIKAGRAFLSSYDGHRASRLVHRSIMSGLLSAGINVFDLGRVAVPVARHAIRSLEAEGGVHCSISPYDPAILDIRFFDDDGMDLPPVKEKAIEGSFYREEFNRVEPEEVGVISFPSRILEYYEEGFLHALDLEVLRKASFRIVMDYCLGNSAATLPGIFGKMGISVVALNAYLDERRLTKTKDEYLASLNTLADIVVSLKANAGFLLEVGAQRLYLVDEVGRILSGDQALACIANLVFSTFRGATIAVPIAASSVFEEMASEYRGKVIYTKTSNRSMMEEAKRKEVQFVGDLKGGYIFPDFQPAFDGMFALAKVLEMLARQGTSLKAVASRIKPKVVLREQIACPWEMKGTVMRRLIEESKGKRTINIDGSKIFYDWGWVFVLPDKDRPILHINAEADDPERAKKLLEEYLRKIEGWLEESE
jgi:mannose-1-phosphate guanylyltransferase/phosphomannomutase